MPLWFLTLLLAAAVVLWPLLLPPACAACGARGRSPCPDCEAAVRPPPPLPPPPGVDRLVAALAYEDEGRELVARLKYRNARSSLPWLAERLAALVDPGDVDLVTWLPTSGRRRRRRGFDQSELLARALARRLHLPCAPLLRRGPGPPQTGRPLAERRRRPPVTASVPRAPARVLVVDDVCTSGASLAAAAAALRGRGARSVLAVTAARALPRGGL
ncbi:MAG TPA: phosphoribosyltransferase family protein [Acidimicrobiales bacterium]|nr:phosphoribosyltransferase family protein [Acidimicrobiales bacterium]